MDKCFRTESDGLVGSRYLNDGSYIAGVSKSLQESLSPFTVELKSSHRPFAAIRPAFPACFSTLDRVLGLRANPAELKSITHSHFRHLPRQHPARLAVLATPGP